MAWHREGGWFHRSINHVVVRHTGRAIHHTSKLVHRLLALGIAVLVIASCALAAASWRLAQGPIELGGGLTDRVRAALVDDDQPVRVSFQGLSLAWEGFQKGVDYPLDLRLSDVEITDPAGRRLVAAPRAHVTFSLAGLLLGRFVPRALEVDHAQIVLTREADGAIGLGLDPAATSDSPDSGGIDLRQFREQLSRPVSGDHGGSRGLFDQIRRIHFIQTGVTLQDRPSGFVVRAPDLDLDLTRTGIGHTRGLLRASLSAGDQQSNLGVSADWATGSGTSLDATLTPVRPAGLGNLPDELAFAAAIDLPVSLTANVVLDASFKPAHLRAGFELGQGQIRLGDGTLPLRAGSMTLSGTQSAISLTKGHFDLAHTQGAAPEIVDVGATIRHQADRLAASVTLATGPLDIATLPSIWPLGVGGGARPWVVEHLTGGLASHGTASFSLEAGENLHDVAVTKATADLDVSNGTFTWLDNIPPVEQTEAHLHLADPDTMDIHLSSGRQRVGGGAADLLVKDSQMRITGLQVKDQDATIRVQVEGPLSSALTLLKEPRLHLLSAHPIALKVAEGDAAAAMDLQFPLENKLRIDDVRLHADAHLANIRLLDVVGGQELDDGTFDLGIDKDGLKLKGQASMAAVPVALTGGLDFTSGPATQVVQKITAVGQPDAIQLQAAGLNVTDLLTGPVPLTVVVTERRGGDGSIAINGDLTQAALRVGPLAWSKPSGAAASASASLLMSHDRVTKLDKIVLHGDDISLAGSADFPDGHMRTLSFDTIRLGRTQGHGTVHFAPNEPIKVVLQGNQIDLSSKLMEKTSTADKPDDVLVTTPLWTLDARFDNAMLANGENASDLLVRATGGGETIALLDVVGTLPSAAGFAVKIEPGSSQPAVGARHLLVETKDAGTFLRGIDAVRGMRSGRLSIDGVFSRPFGLQPLTGTATIDDVVVRNSPILGKLLQAITLYGLVDALRGPGMGFSHIVVPFHYDAGVLNLDAAHGYNSSLGLTVDGRIGLSSGKTELTGTIVPAYFFNSMLGQLPLVGRLFSPEKGGGVFAARFGATGQIEDPKISLNPISALTPGFLREMFNVFDRTPKKEPAPP